MLSGRAGRSLCSPARLAGARRAWCRRLARRGRVRWRRPWGLHLSLAPFAPAFDECAADERDHGLAALVHAGIAEKDDAPIRAAVQNPRLQHLGAVGDGIAGVDRFEPFQLAE